MTPLGRLIKEVQDAFLDLHGVELSYSAIARRAGDRISRQRVQQLAKNEIKEMPDADTLHALADGLGVGWKGVRDAAWLSTQYADDAPPRLRAVGDDENDEGSNPVLAAIEADPYLLPEAKEHFRNQYHLLRQIQRREPGERLPYVAHGKRTEPVDPQEEKRIEDAARKARKANPDAPDTP